MEKCSLTKKSTISTDIVDSFEVMKVQGSILLKYIEMSEALVQYLEKNYPVRINKIVLDFITDYHGEIWIVGCRCIEQ